MHLEHSKQSRTSLSVLGSVFLRMIISTYEMNLTIALLRLSFAKTMLMVLFPPLLINAVLVPMRDSMRLCPEK